MKYDKVVISGGGLKGILALGLLHKYQEQGLYDYEHTKEYAGTSIGAVISILLAIGYKPMELFYELYTLDNLLVIPKTDSFISAITDNGLISIRAFSTVVERLILKKLKSVPTLLELYKLTGKKVSTVTYNLSKELEICHNYITHPDLSCIPEIEMSSNIPGVFKQYTYDGDLYVDGCFSNNIPFEYVNDKTSKILAIVLIGNDTSNDLGVLQYYHRCFQAPINKTTSLICSRATDNIDIVKIYARDVPVISKNISAETKMKLFMIGYKTGEEYIRTETLYVKGWLSNLTYDDEDDDKWDWDDWED